MVSWETLQAEVDFILQYGELGRYFMLLSQDGLLSLLTFSRLRRWGREVTEATKNQ